MVRGVLTIRWRDGRVTEEDLGTFDSAASMQRGVARKFNQLRAEEHVAYYTAQPLAWLYWTIEPTEVAT